MLHPDPDQHYFNSDEQTLMLADHFGSLPLHSILNVLTIGTVGTGTFLARTDHFSLVFIMFEFTASLSGFTA